MIFQHLIVLLMQVSPNSGTGGNRQGKMPPRLLSAAPASKRSLQANMKSIDKQVEVYQQPLQAVRKKRDLEGMH